ncbi:MAG: ABC transporter ATP-binding protein [Lachnospiraceae bacterium]|nr:ABC transporter ATP-binding protein [Lachnospiraceae bacterium]
MDKTAAVSLHDITKRFGSTVANDHVSMEIRKGEILSLLGENGSGKTTLMNMLSGIYFPDEGEIRIGGEPVTIRSPHDAFACGIGMIHQHFKLVDVFTAVENVVLGLDGPLKLDLKKAAAQIEEICARYGFKVDPWQKVYDMSVSQKQTLEIIKVLYRGARILILDEPTAVLTPQETDRLFAIIRAMRDDGKSIVIITHKLNEVLAVSDRVAILRRGAYLGCIETKDATEQILTEMMVGQKVELNIRRTEPRDLKKRLSVRGLTVVGPEGLDALEDVSFDAYGGEILGIAGISGSGQKQLLESIAGLQKVEPGSSIVYTAPEDEQERQLIGRTPLEIRELGVLLSFVPEDRLGMGLVGSMGMTGNMLLKTYGVGHQLFVKEEGAKKLAEEIMEQLAVVTPGINTPVRRLSGGNVQKVLVGREIAAKPAVLMTAYAVRGLDINTSYTIYNLLCEQKEKGTAVIYVGEDLDVLLALCDRILVLCGGRCNGILDARTATKEEIGLRMTKLQETDHE